MPPSDDSYRSATRTYPHADEARELELVEQIRAGDQGAWTELLERYQNRLYTICLRMVSDRHLAADLTQDAMVKIILGLETYDGRSKLSTWMIRVTMNVCLSRLRSEKLRRHASMDAMREASERGSEPNLRLTTPFEQAREPTSSERIELDERRRILAEAMGRVAPEQRAILILRDARGLDYEQIAEVLDIAVGTVKSRLFRARTALRRAAEKIERPARAQEDATPDRDRHDGHHLP